MLVSSREGTPAYRDVLPTFAYALAMNTAWLAIVLGVLMIATRTPLVVRPAETLDFYRRLFETDARVRATGLFYFGLGVASYWAAADTSGLLRQALGFLIVAFLGMTIWTWAAPTHFRTTCSDIFRFIEESVDAAILRWLGMLGVGVGALLVLWGARAL
jgi:hypothetical protein